MGRDTLENEKGHYWGSEGTLLGMGGKRHYWGSEGTLTAVRIEACGRALKTPEAHIVSS